MVAPPGFQDIHQTIQLSVAPVFLLTGIAGLLNVMMSRLARIIDRGRHFDTHWPTMADAERADARAELLGLERRRQLASRAIHALVVSALLVCMVVAVLFVEALWGWPLQWLVASLFVGSMAGVTIGLATFYREVTLATGTIRLTPLDERQRRTP